MSNPCPGNCEKVECSKVNCKRDSRNIFAVTMKMASLKAVSDVALCQVFSPGSGSFSQGKILSTTTGLIRFLTMP